MGSYRTDDSALDLERPRAQRYSRVVWLYSVVTWLGVDFEKKLLPTRTLIRPHTPLVFDLEGNSKSIEEIQEGDWLLARNEIVPQGALELKRVEEK